MMNIVHVVPAVMMGGIFREMEIAERLPLDEFCSTVISIFDRDEPTALRCLTGRIIRANVPMSAYRNEDAICGILLTHFQELRPTLVHSYHCFSDFYSFPAATRLEIPCVRSVLGITQASVKGGAKLDHWGGEKVDHLRGWERPWFEGFTGAAGA